MRFLRKYAHIILCCSALALFAPGIVRGADESCATTVTECHKAISSTATNSTVNFGFVAGSYCIRNSDTTNEVYVRFDNTAATANPDQSMYIPPAATATAFQTFCFGNEQRTQFLQIINDAGETATVYVDAWRR